MYSHHQRRRRSPSTTNHPLSCWGAGVAHLREVARRFGVGLAAGLVLVVGFAGVAVAAIAPQAGSRQARVASVPRSRRAVSKRTALHVRGDSLGWGRVAGASRYVLASRVGRSAADYQLIRGTRYTPGLRPGATVRYRVRADLGSAPWTGFVSIRYGRLTEAEMASANVAPVLHVRNGEISWAAQRGVRDFSGAISTAAEGVAGRTTTYQDLGNVTSWSPAPVPGQTLYYGVASNGPAGQQWASEVSITWPSSGTQSGGSGSGYTVNHNVIQDNGLDFWPHGVDRDTTEWSCTGETADGSGNGVPASDFTTMKSKWGANIVRIALNEDFWDPDGNEYCSSYQSNIEAEVAHARAAGLVVILDLHWSDAGDTAGAAQQCMADAHSDEMWKDLAAIYKGDSGVWFELYNEPENISWSVWQNGGSTCGFSAVGMQQLINDIRAQGASNIVIACGIGYCSHDDGMPQLTGGNIVYGIHPYSNTCGSTSCENQWSDSDWMNRFGYLTQTGPVPSGDNMDDVPVIATEFGDFTCGGTTYDNAILQFFQQNGIGYTAWAWYTGGCDYPALISDAAGDCLQAMGCTIQQNLLGFANGSLQMTIPGGGPSQSTASAISSAAVSHLTSTAPVAGTAVGASGGRTAGGGTLFASPPPGS